MSGVELQTIPGGATDGRVLSHLDGVRVDAAAAIARATRNVRLPREARDGVLRVWMEILRERHPGSSWVAADDSEVRA